MITVQQYSNNATVQSQLCKAPFHLNRSSYYCKVWLFIGGHAHLASVLCERERYFCYLCRIDPACILPSLHLQYLFHFLQWCYQCCATVQSWFSNAPFYLNRSSIWFVRCDCSSGGMTIYQAYFVKLGCLRSVLSAVLCSQDEQRATEPSAWCIHCEPSTASPLLRQCCSHRFTVSHGPWLVALAMPTLSWMLDRPLMDAHCVCTIFTQS